MSLLRQLAGETVVYGMSHILPRILHYIIFTIYLTRTFPDTKDYGIYNDLYAYSSIILIILIYRMDTAYFRFSSRESDKQSVFSTALIPLFISGILFISMVLLFRHDIAHFLGYAGQAHYVIWFGFIMIFDAFVALPFARFRMENRPYRFLFYRLLNVGLTVFFVFFFLEIAPFLQSRGYLIFDRLLILENRLDYVFLSNLLASGLIFLAMLPELFRDRLSFNSSLCKSMLKYSLPLVVVGIAGSFNQTFGTPLQKYFLGEDIMSNLASAGIYNATLKIALLLNLSVVAFNYAAEPFFFKYFADRKDKDIYGLVALGFTIVACFILLGIYLYIDIIQLIIGANYREALFLLPILLFAYLFLGLYYNFSIWYKLVDKTIIGTYISLGGAMLTLFISITFLAQFGYAASAWAALACYAFMAMAGLVTGKMYYPIPYPILKIAGYIALSICIVVLSNYLANFTNSIFSKLLVNSLLLLVYVGIIALSEKELFSQFRRKKV